MFDVAKIYLRSIVGCVSTTAGICYLATVQSVSEPTLLAWLAAATAMVLLDKPKTPVA